MKDYLSELQDELIGFIGVMVFISLGLGVPVSYTAQVIPFYAGIAILRDVLSGRAQQLL